MRSILTDESIPQQQPDVWLRLAGRLLDVLRAKKLAPRVVRLRSWAKEFRLLGKETPQEEIESVLGWYAQYAGQERVPQAYNAREFRLKYKHIAGCVRKDYGGVEVTPDALWVQEELVRAGWEGDAKYLAPFAQQVINDFTPFRHRLLALLSWDVHPRVKRVIQHLLDSGYLLPKHFALRWASEYFSWVKNAGPGVLAECLFTPQSTQLEWIMRQWVGEYCGDGDRWQEVVEELKKHEG